MARSRLTALRLLAAGGLAGIALAAPTLTVTTTSATLAGCPNGESSDTFTGSCVPDIVPNSHGFTTAPNQLPQIDGIPCNGANSGECIGLSEEQQGPQVTPHSSVGGSPTVTGSIG